VRTHNPISEDHVQMRTTLLGGLLDAARHNHARDVERIALFESGRAFLSEPPPAGRMALAGGFPGKLAAPVREPHRIAALVAGELAPAGWRRQADSAEGAGFYALKGALEVLGEQLGAPVALAAAPQPFLHPGRAAAIGVAGSQAGWIGELHPLVARAWDLPPCAAFELDLAPLVELSDAGEEAYEDVTTFPAVLQDLAVTVPEDVPAQRLRDAVRAGGGELLTSAEVFDVYRGEQLGGDQKSLALRLEFRAPDRTLTDAEVAELRERIKGELAEIGGSIRE